MNKPIRRVSLQADSPQDAGAVMSRRKAYGGPAAGRGAAGAVTPKTRSTAEQPAASTHDPPHAKPAGCGRPPPRNRPPHAPQRRGGSNPPRSAQHNGRYWYIGAMSRTKQ